jgi:hypothetical protein
MNSEGGYKAMARYNRRDFMKVAGISTAAVVGSVKALGYNDSMENTS